MPLSVVTELFKYFLLGARIEDHSISDTVKNKFISMMRDLEDLLARFASIILERSHVSNYFNIISLHSLFEGFRIPLIFP